MRYKRVLLLFPDYKGGHFGALRPPAGIGYLAETLMKNQIEYDMHQGVDKKEVIQLLRKIRFNKKYAGLRSDAQAIGRLVDLEEQLSGAKIEERLLWHDKVYREKIAARRTHTSNSMLA